MRDFLVCPVDERAVGTYRAQCTRFSSSAAIKVALVLRLLRRCFGALDSQQVARIQALSVTELEALGEALLDFQTAADLTAWLQQSS